MELLQMVSWLVIIKEQQVQRAQEQEAKHPKWVEWAQIEIQVSSQPDLVFWQNLNN